MMRPAQEEQVRKRGLATVGPMHHVMRITPGLRTIASRKPAVLVADHDRSSDRRWNHRSPPAHVERLGASGEHYPCNRRVAGKTPSGFRIHWTDMVEFREAETLCGKRRDGHRHRKMRPFAGHDRSV